MFTYQSTENILISEGMVSEIEFHNVLLCHNLVNKCFHLPIHWKYLNFWRNCFLNMVSKCSYIYINIIILKKWVLMTLIWRFRGKYHCQRNLMLPKCSFASHLSKEHLSSRVSEHPGKSPANLRWATMFCFWKSVLFFCDSHPWTWFCQCFSYVRLALSCVWIS